jgi:hypothetical protein
MPTAIPSVQRAGPATRKATIKHEPFLTTQVYIHNLKSFSHNNAAPS